jgi:enoyl-CoA hydratase/carnithine racemase
VLRTERNGGTLVVVMEHSPVNAFGAEFVAAWNALLDDLDAERTSVLVIRSAQKVFSAGADLKMMREVFAHADAGERLVAHVAGMQRVFDRIEAAPVVSIAEIGGAAMGGGFELALACDLRVAGHNARIGLPETRIGLIPGAGGTQRLTRLCGAAVAKRVILGCDILDGASAERLGLAQWSVPDADLAEFTTYLAARISSQSKAALRAGKRCIAAAQSALDTGLLLERLETLRLVGDDDTRGRIKAFLEK